MLKFLLHVVASISHTIVVVLAGLVVAIPITILIITGIATWVRATVAVKAFFIAVAIVGGLLLLSLVIGISAFVGAPIAFFFPSYTIHFLAGRYEPLGKILYPAAPSAVQV